MKVGSLFSGGGLGDFGFLAAGIDVAWQCEIDEYCQKILAMRYPESRKYHDIKLLKGAELEPVDIVAGGFPCQPFSVAGNQRGREDDRYLWPEMLRVISEVKPTWVVGENVPGIIPISLDDVLNDLATLGYETGSFVFPAHACGASHRRDRLWIVGYSEQCRKNKLANTSCDEGRKLDGDSKKDAEKGVVADAGLLRSTQHEKQTTGIEQLREALADTPLKRCDEGPNNPRKKRKKDGGREPTVSSEMVANTNSEGLQGQRGKSESLSKREAGYPAWHCSEEIFRKYWQFEPDVGRVAHGIANRVHRLKMLGNGQVPACTFILGKMIMEIENEYRPT